MMGLCVKKADDILESDNPPEFSCEHCLSCKERHEASEKVKLEKDKRISLSNRKD